MALLRDFLAPNVQRLKAKGDVDGLIKALAYEKDPNVRQRAARALGELRAQVALEPLGDSLKDPSPMVRRSAVYALGKIGGSQVVPLLGAVAQDRDVYNDAAVALSVIGDAAAAEALIPALGSRGDVGATAAAALASMGPPALGPLIAALADESPEVREKAAGVLGQLGDQRAVAPLKLALRDGLVGEPAREALKKLGSIPVAVRPRSAAKKGMDQAGVAAQPPPTEPAVGKTASWMQQRVTSVPEETAPAEAREPQQEEPAGDALSLAVEETLAWLDRRDRPLEKAEEPAPEAEEPQKDESAGKDPSLHVVETQVWLQHVAGTPGKSVTPSAAVSEALP